MPISNVYLILLLSGKKCSLPAKGVLFGYHILLKRRDGIMINAETITGG